VDVIIWETRDRFRLKAEVSAHAVMMTPSKAIWPAWRTLSVASHNELVIMLPDINICLDIDPDKDDIVAIDPVKARFNTRGPADVIPVITEPARTRALDIVPAIPDSDMMTPYKTLSSDEVAPCDTLVISWPTIEIDRLIDPANGTDVITDPINDRVTCNAPVTALDVIIDP
jgi:hypothetical protein